MIVCRRVLRLTVTHSSIDSAWYVSNGPSGGQIMLIAKRLKNYTGYVTTKSRDRGVATSPPRSVICNTVQYEYD